MTAFSLRDLEDSSYETTTPVRKISPCRNAIEPLVEEEVERQLQHLPPQMVKYIDPVQVLAYALNRLPALYATSEEGWHRQQLRAKQHLSNQIFTAVRQGFAAVQKDPLRVATPLKWLT